MEYPVITDYYKFEKLDDTKSRIDCTASTRGYMPFEKLRCKKGTQALSLYIQPNTFAFAGDTKKAKYSLSKNGYISGMFAPFKDAPNFMCGDVQCTDDCLLFVMHNFRFNGGQLLKGAVIEVFVARKQKEFAKDLCKKIGRGELSRQVAELKKKAEAPQPTMGDLFFL